MTITSADLQRILDRRTPGIANAHAQIAQAQREIQKIALRGGNPAQMWSTVQPHHESIGMATFAIRRIAELN